MERMEILETVVGEGPRFDLWGRLVKTWATEVDHVKNGGTFLPPPKTITELEQQCTAAGVNIKIPDRYRNNPIQYAQADENTMLIRLPPAALVNDSAEKLSQPGNNYPIPAFYKRIFQMVNPVIPHEDKERVNSERIGDYTIANCF
jgi:hypothetical protein